MVLGVARRRHRNRLRGRHGDGLRGRHGVWAGSGAGWGVGARNRGDYGSRGDSPKAIGVLGVRQAVAVVVQAVEAGQLAPSLRRLAHRNSGGGPERVSGPQRDGQPRRRLRPSQGEVRSNRRRQGSLQEGGVGANVILTHAVVPGVDQKCGGVAVWGKGHVVQPLVAPEEFKGAGDGGL